MFLECWDVRLFQTVLEHKALLPLGRENSGHCFILAMPSTPIFHTIKFWVRVFRGLCTVPPPHRCLRMGVMDTGV